MSPVPIRVVVADDSRPRRPGDVLVVGATERVTDAAEYGLVSRHPFIYHRES
jgi:hypothetical protein